MKSKLIILAFAAMSLAACNNPGQKTESTEVKQDSAQQDSSIIAPEAGDVVIYQCPMKCEGEKVYSNPGQCPVCGMDLEKATVRGNDTIRG